MNNIIFQDFSQQLRMKSEELVLDLSKHPLDTKETLLKIKSLRDSLSHLSNYVKIEEFLQNKDK